MRADKDRLTYGRTGRREQEGAQHAEGGKRGDMTGGYEGRGRGRNSQGRKQERTKRKEMKKGKKKKKDLTDDAFVTLDE